MLLSLTRRIARAGRLGMEPELAAQVVWSTVFGVTSMLSSRPDFGRFGALNAVVREAVISAITLPGREDDAVGAAEGREVAGFGALRLLGVLEADEAGGGSEDPLRGFSGAEASLLKEWLGRLAADADRTGAIREQTDEEEQR